MNISALSMSRLYERMLNCPVAVISSCRAYNLAIMQAENTDLVCALVKDIACNSLNKRYQFIFDIDNPLKMY
ncbi:hypothetical protein ID1001_14140 [Helicobacter pylori]